MTIRSPRPDEAGAVAALIGARWPEGYDEESVRKDWTAPSADMERNARVAVERGRIVGYAAIEDLEGAHERFWVEVHGEPAGDLLDWAETRIQATAAAGARLFGGTWSPNEPLGELFAARGYRQTRHSYRMAIELAGEGEAVTWPEGVEVRTFRAGDERAVYEAHMETFADSWEHVHESFDEWRHWQLGSEAFDPSLWFLAAAGADLAGIALCRRHSTRDDLGWVQVLGVRRPWRRRGLGRALLLHAFAEFRRKGYRRAGLGVDAESLTGANRLYERAGMSVEHRFDFYERAL